MGHRAAGADNRARADSSPRDWDAAAPPGPPAAATPAARESRPRWQALYSVVPPCRLSRQRRAAGAGHLLSLGRARKPRLSPLKNYRARVPAAAATQTPAATSYFRERVASKRRAGAVSRRARNASAAVHGGGRKNKREARR